LQDIFYRISVANFTIPIQKGLKMDAKMKCQNQKCNAELPIFDEKGNHNFCPQVQKNGKIIDVCMKCKTAELEKIRKKI
jgi:hypothetical protein